MSRQPEPTKVSRERVLVCGVLFPDFAREFGGELSEARALAAAAEANVVGEGITQRRRNADPATLMGKGKVEEVKEQVDLHQPDAIVVDNDLTPAQVRNLEKAWGGRVVDRSELILDIFARRAQTRQAQLQVELAQNEYLLPRLRRMWTHLERMEGAIGTRGPGETQLETDRRLLDRRISDLKGELRRIEQRKQLQVAGRSQEYKVGLVGYTNAGKSTLLNRLTGSHELVADMPFATLDTRTRQWVLPDRRVVLLSDTVGFLQRLPHHLVASFHATLEEAVQADLLLHVVDVSHPDAAIQMSAVDDVLGQISPNMQADLIVFNKVDRVQDPIQLQLLLEDRLEVDVVHTSAHSGEGMDRLAAQVARRLDERAAVVRVQLSAGEGRLISMLRASGVLLSEEYGDNNAFSATLRISPRALGNLERSAGDRARIEILEQPRARPFSGDSGSETGPAA